MRQGVALLALLAAGIPADPLSAPAAIFWRTDEALARAEAERTGQPLLIDAWADWCAACKLLERHTWSDPRVQQEIQAHFIPLRIDMSEEGAATEARMTSYGVVALPAVLVCSPRTCNASARRSVGYVDPSTMLEFLRGSRAQR